MQSILLIFQILSILVKESFESNETSVFGFIQYTLLISLFFFAKMVVAHLENIG